MRALSTKKVPSLIRHMHALSLRSGFGREKKFDYIAVSDTNSIKSLPPVGVLKASLLFTTTLLVL